MRRIEEWIDSAGTTEDLVRAWRLTILNGLLWAIVLFGLPVALNYILVKQEPFSPVMIAYYVGVIVAFMNRSEVKIRGSIVLAALFFAGVAEMRDAATVGAYRIIFTVFVCYAVLFFGLRGGVAALLLSILAMTGAAYLFTIGTLVLAPPYEVFALDVSDWLSKGMTFIFLATCLMISTSYLQSSLVRVVEKFQLQIEELQAQRVASEHLRDQLHHAQRLESIGQLAGGIAHDFNNLLQGILGYCELAIIKVPQESPVHDDIEQIMRAGEKARELVRQLLAFSRQQVLQLSDLNLNYVIGDSVRLVQRVIGEHISFENISGSDLGIISADRGQIEQIVMNLCVNARDAMDAGGRLTIETRAVELDDEYCKANSWAQPGRYVLLLVSDTGCGISEDVQQRMFEPFYSTKEQGKGSGLGLATVFGIVRQHNGMINVSSEVGRGTTFEIYFPTVDRPATVVESNEPSPVLGGTETVLLADDDEMVLAVAAATLKESGYTVLTAVDGEMAIAMFEKHLEEIDVVVLDVVMPKLGGKAVAEHILKNHAGFPVLFTSGYNRDFASANSNADSGIALIQKPYQRAELLRKIREVIELHS